MHLVPAAVWLKEFLQEGEILLSSVMFYCSGSELGKRTDGKGITGCAEDGKSKSLYTVRSLFILLLLCQLSIAK